MIAILKLTLATRIIWFERVRIRKFLADLDRQDAAIGDIALSSGQLRRLGAGAARLSAAADKACDRIIGKRLTGIRRVMPA